MTARDTLRNLTVPLAIVVLVACLTAVLQVPGWMLALLAELSEAAVIAGQAHLTRRVVIVTDVRYPYRPRGTR
jgi:hypothetical protein